MLWVKWKNEHKCTDQKQNKHKISHRCKHFSDFDNDQLRHRFLRYFLCEDKHYLVDCFHLSAAQELVKKCKDKDKTRYKNVDDFQTFIELLKNKYKKYRVYNVKSDSEISDNDENDENKESKNIAALLKNIINKISEFNWIANSDVFLHMTDQLQLFSKSLICIKKCIIKVEKRKLYVNHCDTAIMQNHHENSVKLFFILHVSKFEVNLLSERRMCKKDLQESFDDKDLYMHNKWEKQMIETLKCKDVYIVKRIANDLDEFALLSAMQHDISSAFSAMYSSMNLNDSMNLNHSASHTNVIHHENKIKVDHD